MKIVLLGAPGSGKGTQASYITNKYNLPHISTGDIFRDNIKNGTPLGEQVKYIMNTGMLCPDDLTVEMVKDRLRKADCENGYLLDGFPRNLFQAESLAKFDAPDYVLNIEIELNKIKRRITGRRSCPQCGKSFHIDFIGDVKECPACKGTLITRKDDNPETVKERLAVYESQTKPLIEYYRNKGKLININGDQDVQLVFEEIVKVLEK